jgi:hypothetical protein
MTAAHIKYAATFAFYQKQFVSDFGNQIMQGTPQGKNDASPIVEAGPRLTKY